MIIVIISSIKMIRKFLLLHTPSGDYTKLSLPDTNWPDLQY